MPRDSSSSHVSLLDAQGKAVYNSCRSSHLQLSNLHNMKTKAEKTCNTLAEPHELFLFLKVLAHLSLYVDVIQ